MSPARFDQHFMVSADYLDRFVAHARLTEDDTVVEVGAGLGYLTERIASKAAHVTAIEKDPHLIPLLRERLEAHPNTSIIQGDALSVSWPPHTVVMSNVPYSISRDLVLTSLIEGFERAIYTLQNEFAEKLAAPVGDSRYRYISATVQSLATVELLDAVPNDAFDPPPPIQSRIVRLTGCPPADERFIAFIRQLFNHRGKKVRNVLEDSVPPSFEHRRVSSLTPEEFRALYTHYPPP